MVGWKIKIFVIKWQYSKMAVSKEERIKNLLKRNVQEVIELEHLRKLLLSGKKLRVKLGIDPTSPDLHLGHAVILRKLREFQGLGHKVVLIIGDFTGKIGDPSGRSETRKPLTDKEVKGNMKSYLKQAGKIIDIKKAEIVYNSKWFLKDGIQQMIELATASSIQQVLRRADFKQRIQEDSDITFLELLYPLFQGYDSLKVKADVELGGIDQKFNLLMGRRVQRHFGMKEQDILMVPLLEGLDGVKKMSKSFGNYIGLDEGGGSMFGKIMSLPDPLTAKYFYFCTEVSEDEVLGLEKRGDPRGFKERLAFEVVKIYHGEKEANLARDKFSNLFSKKLTPENLPTLKSAKEISVADLVLASKLVVSKAQAWRLVEQGGFSLNDVQKKNPREVLSLKGGEVAKIGKKSFFKIKV